jgi:hypothetical protein
MSLYVDARRNLHIRDGGPTWTVLSPNLEFMRRVSASEFGGSSRSTVVLDDGTILSSRYSPSATPRWFRMADSTGRVRSEVGPLEPRDLVAIPGESRPIANAGGERFWAAPTRRVGGYERLLDLFPGTSRGYVHTSAPDGTPRVEIIAYRLVSR